MHLAGLGRTALGAAALLTTWLAGAAAADAQNITVGITNFEGRTARTGGLADIATQMASPIGLGECDSAITFRFSNVDRFRTSLEFFEGDNCDDPDERTDETSTTCVPLDVPPVAIDNRSQIDQVITVRELLPDACEEGSGQLTLRVWVLALSGRTDTVTGAGQKHDFPVAYRFTAPGEPGGFTATGGENAISVQWSSQSNAEKYEVFVDPSACTSTGEFSGEGLSADEPDTSGLTPHIRMGTAATVDYPEGVVFGDYVGVAVRATDNAGNVGDLSSVECVQRIETISWWDMMCPPGSTDEICTSGGCSVSPGRSGAGALALLALALAAFVTRRKIR